MKGDGLQDGSLGRNLTHNMSDWSDGTRYRAPREGENIVFDDVFNREGFEGAAGGRLGSMGDV